MSARRNNTMQGRYSVTGPEGEFSAPSVGAGISLAQTLASRRGEEHSYYVRDFGGEIAARIDREDGVILTWSWKESR